MNQFFKNREMAETTPPETENYQEIKPRTEEYTIQEARNFLDHLFCESEDIVEEDNPDKDANDASDKTDSPETRDLTDDEINDRQRREIRDAFVRILRGEKLTDAEKGNLGEMLMDQYYIALGYRPIHQPRVTDLTHKSGQGIDGVYEKVNIDGSKSYVIADAKVNHSQLNKGLADGTDQMSDAWIDKRLDNAVGKEKADEIRDTYEDRPENISRQVYHFSYGDANGGMILADISTVDEDGNKNNDTKLVQIFDAYGNYEWADDNDAGGDNRDEG